MTDTIHCIASTMTITISFLWWVDNNIVDMVSSCHKGTEEKHVNRARKRPRNNQINCKNICIIRSNNHTVNVDIPMLVDDYNNWMMGVDLADQLIAYYWSKLRCRHTWMLIMLHCLDVLRINAYILYKQISKQRGIKIPKKYCHKKFLLRLVDSLITQAEDATTKSPWKSKRTLASAPIKELVSCVQVPSEDKLMILFDKKDLSLNKLDHICFEEAENKRVLAKQGKCKYCLYLYLKAKALAKDKAVTRNEKSIWPKIKKPMQKCSICKVNLWWQHFDLWHSREEKLF